MNSNSFNIPFNKPSLVGNEIKYVRDAVRRGQLAGDGALSREPFLVDGCATAIAH
ncbi:MAG: hypothetical protein AAFY51_04735 [Pseudomonadota bacterium]